MTNALSATEFIETLFADLSGYLCIAKTDDEGRWNRHEFYTLPDQMAAALTDVEWSTEATLGYSPFLYSQPWRKGDDEGAVTKVIGVDADHHGAEEFKVEPSIVIETSPGSFHLLWLLAEPVSQVAAVAVGRSMTRTHGLEATASLPTKLLRVPGSLNGDSEKQRNKAPFRVTGVTTGNIYTLAELEAEYPPVSSAVMPALDIDMPATLPTLFEAESKLPDSKRLSELMHWQEHEQEGDERHKRSERIFELTNLLLEQGLTPEEALVVGWSSKPVQSHYVEKNRPQSDYWRFDVLKAYAHQQGKQVDMGEHESTEASPVFVNLLTAEEREIASDPSFIDWWIDHCYTRLDHRTPEQYLVANGFMLLANTLGASGSGYFDGERLSPNLYMLNLGPTTTGKTKALKFLRKCIRAYEDFVGYQIDIGNDATPEGLVKALLEYEGKMALISRDEVGGMFADWVAKGSYAAAPEAYMALYDNELLQNLRSGKDAGNNKRIHLAAFNTYMMGTPERVYKVLTEEFYQTGFMQRLVPITGHRDEMTRESYVKRQGNPNEVRRADELPMEIASRLKSSSGWWGKKNPVLLADASAFARWEDFGWSMLQSVQNHKKKDVLGAVTERLSISVLKMCVGLTLEDRRNSISLATMLHVIQHAEQWLANIFTMVDNISASEHSRRVDELVRFIISKSNRVTPVQVHGFFGAVPPKDRLDIIESAKMQGLLIEVRDTKTNKVWYEVRT